jgi:hypothetical protein
MAHPKMAHKEITMNETQRVLYIQRLICEALYADDKSRELHPGLWSLQDSLGKQDKGGIGVMQRAQETCLQR